jgi:hypothetical protein
VLLAIGGGLGGVGSSTIFQRLDAWGNATAANRRVPKGKMVTAQVKVHHSAGTLTTNDLFSIAVAQYDAGGVFQGYAKLKTRFSNDTVSLAASPLTVFGTVLLAEPRWTLLWATFQLDDTLTTAYIRAEFIYSTLNYSGVNLAITEPMLNFGDGMGYWTAMIDPNTTYQGPSGGAPTPKPRFVDRDAIGLPYLEIE